jgi:predicted nucleotidyltransferase/DNA-binding XRE family transcriptional regulator
MGSTAGTSHLLREARLAAGLTQRRLAELAKTSQPAVAAYESGARQPTISTLDRLLAACDHELILDIRRATVRSRPTLALVRRHRRRLLDSAARHGARNVRIFGSVARDATSAESDVDLLVDLDRERTLVDLAALRADASMILGLPVDIATADLLKPHVRADVLDHAVAL